MPYFKLQAEALANSLKWNLRKSSTFVSHILFDPVFSLFFPQQKNPRVMQRSRASSFLFNYFGG